MHVEPVVPLFIYGFLLITKKRCTFRVIVPPCKTKVTKYPISDTRVNITLTDYCYGFFIQRTFAYNLKTVHF